VKVPAQIVVDIGLEGKWYVEFYYSVSKMLFLVRKPTTPPPRLVPHMPVEH
jgi:hypothetical protein